MMSVCTEQLCRAEIAASVILNAVRKPNIYQNTPIETKLYNSAIATLNGMRVFDCQWVVLAALQSKMDALQLSFLYSVHRQGWKLKCPQSPELASTICIAVIDVMSVTVCECHFVCARYTCMLALNPAELFIFTICFSIHLLIWRLNKPSS